MATLGLSKVFILDKYFTELQKFWETEKKLQGVCSVLDVMVVVVYVVVFMLAGEVGVGWTRREGERESRFDRYKNLNWFRRAR